MLIAIVPVIASLESLLNNLTEADFVLTDVTVILSDSTLRSKLIGDGGPLKGVALADLPARLAQLGLKKSAVKLYVAAVTSGKAFIAMTVTQDTARAATEMFQDVQATNIKLLP